MGFIPDIDAVQKRQLKGAIPAKQKYWTKWR